MALADVVLETIPLGFLGVLVLLTRIAVLAARTPVLISRALVAAGTGIVAFHPVAARAAVTRRAIGETWPLIIALRARTLPTPLSLAESGVARLIA